MPYTIKCPHCFKEFDDEHVHFRSERVSDPAEEILPIGYEDIEKFKNKYEGEDKEQIIKRYESHAFFLPQEDETYENVWKDLDKTEYVSEGSFKPWERKVINPYDLEHKKYLIQQTDGTYFIRDQDGMVKQIELSEDTANHKMSQKCHRRVCPFCHNPIPNNYGKYEVKFISIIGVKGSGKTVYLSQLLSNLSYNYAPRIGLSADVTTPEILNFIRKNQIKRDCELPKSTPAKMKQQPLYYQVTRPDPDRLGKVINETMVLYDVAGEVFDISNDEAHASLGAYASYVINSDAYMLLIKPEQLTEGEDGAADTALTAIHGLLEIKDGEKCEKPLAVCVSQADSQQMINLLNNGELINRISSDVTVANGKFNATDYNYIGKNLTNFFRSPVTHYFDNIVKSKYKDYAYFAFSALGCNVEQKDNVDYPASDPLPKRIEEPLYWLFYKLGYIKSNEPVYGDIKCPQCDKIDIEDITGSTKTEQVEERTWYGKIRMKTIQVPVNYKCTNCGHQWYYQMEEAYDE